jgi:hypothetical protein
VSAQDGLGGCEVVRVEAENSPKPMWVTSGRINVHLAYTDKRVRGSLVAGVRAHLTQSGDTVPKG